MPVKYKYTDKEGNAVPLSRVNDEIPAYRCERGVTHQAYNVEGLVSEIGILMLMNTGGFTFTEEKIRKLGEKLNLGEGVCDLCVEFFVKRYTFEAWR